MSRLITGLILGGLLICYAWSCGDDFMTVERRIIAADNKVPMYFYAEAEQAGSNTWKPVFTYLIYSLEEGEYDAYFHAYMVNNNDSILWSGIGNHSGGVFCPQIVTALDKAESPYNSPSLGVTDELQISSQAVAVKGTDS